MVRVSPVFAYTVCVVFGIASFAFGAWAVAGEYGADLTKTSGFVARTTGGTTVVVAPRLSTATTESAQAQEEWSIGTQRFDAERDDIFPEPAVVALRRGDAVDVYTRPKERAIERLVVDGKQTYRRPHKLSVFAPIGLSVLCFSAVAVPVYFRRRRPSSVRYA